VHKRREDLEDNNDKNGRIEMIVVEFIIKSEKWMFTSIYKQPKVKDSDFYTVLDRHIVT
jgi:hypothetical protein